MKKLNVIVSSLAILISLTAFSQTNDKLVSTKTHLKFFSHTSVEDIEANNYTSVSTLNKETGNVVFSVPMQGFEFEKDCKTLRKLATFFKTGLQITSRCTAKFRKD